MKKPTKDIPTDKSPSHKHQTKGVKTLLGDPKKAIIKLARPMILAMSTHTIYNLVDAIWVSGLGADALAAVGFFFPFFFIAMAPKEACFLLCFYFVIFTKLLLPKQ